jgi:hypothetical protein
MICNSNLVPIFFTILCCAGLFIFLNSRLIEVKTSVEKQNRVLTSFITNVQQDLRGGSNMMGSGVGPAVPPKMAEASKHFATPEALIAARRQEMEKIVVSDDEEDDDDDDSESESDSDEEGDAECMPVMFEVLSFVNPHAAAASAAASAAAESSISEIMEDTLMEIDFEDLGKSEDVAKVGEDVAKVDEVQSAKGEDLNYDQMRVDDLRKIVSDKNLASKDDVKKLKKPELLMLLKK